MSILKQNKPPMLIIAEKAMTQREIAKQLTIYANQISGTTDSRQKLIERLNEYCDEHYWSGFSRKRTIEGVAAKVSFFRRYI